MVIVLPDLVVANDRDATVSVFLNFPTVSIASGTAADEAGPTSGTVAIALDTPAPTGGLTVNFNLTGSTATNPADYTFTAGSNLTAVTATSFTIAAGQTSATLNIVTVDDAIAEGAETVQLTLDTGTGYLVSSTDGAATVQIADNEPVISVAAGGDPY